MYTYVIDGVGTLSPAARSGSGALSSSFALFLLLPGEVPSTTRDAVVVAIHTVETLASLGENKLVYTFLAAPASEAFSVKRIVARHNRLVQNWLPAHLAIVAVRADWRTVGEQ